MFYGAMKNEMNNDLTIDQTLSLYIYGIALEFANETFIYNLFKNLNIGEVDSVYFREASMQDGASVAGYDTIVYMKQWYSNCMVETLQEKVVDPSLEARLVYDDPNYWVLYKNNVDMYSDLENLRTLVTNQTEQLYIMSTQMSDMDSQIKLQETNLEHLTNKLDTMNGKSSSKQANNVVVSNETQQLYTNNSCCGAASDAWVPSYPSTNIWTQRLRPRTSDRATYM
jgi:hypothetical protein